MSGRLIPFPEKEPVSGELVDADHDGEPDTTHATTPGERHADLVERPDAEPVHVGPVHEGELVDDPPKQVNPPAVRMPFDMRVKTAERRPIFPKWLQSKDTAREVGVWAAGHVGHVTAYHGVRLPLYGAKLAGWAPVGVGRAVWAVLEWVFDAEGQPMRTRVAQGTDPEIHLRLRRQREETTRRRAVTAAILAALAAGALTAAFLLVVVVFWVIVAIGVIVLGFLGAPKDKPVVGRAVVVERWQRLTDDMVEKALRSLGIAALSAKDAKIEFTAPIHRDGPGWRAEVDLPHGVTVTDVMERRDRVASGLRRPLGCVWPEPATDEHTGRLVLWVGDQAMNKAKPAPWPLAKGKPVDIFAGLPFMVDQRGRPVGIDLVFNNLLVGSIPRMGKTFTVRQVALGAALDPYVRIRIHELKGTGDLAMLESIAHRYSSGAGNGSLDETMDSLREMAADLERRAETISRIAKFDRARCPENKVTPELSRDQTLGLGIELLIIDECQNLFSHKDYRDDATDLCEKIIKLGPAMGQILLLATQRPDARSLPKAISDNMGIRFCLRVMGQEANDMILGTSMYKAGVRATLFAAKDKGIGFALGIADDPMIGRTYYIDGPQAERIAGMAYVLREKAGTLTGHAAGEQLDGAERVSLWDDVATVFGAADRMHSEQIVAGLARLRPDYYGAWTVQQFGQMVTTEQVWIKEPADGGSKNRQGLKRATVMAQIERKSGVEE